MGTRRINSFQTAWLSKPEYKDWLRKKSKTHATCILCKRDFAVDNMGEAAIKSHARGGTHAQLAKEQADARKSLSILHFVGDSDQPASIPSSSTPTALPPTPT